MQRPRWRLEKTRGWQALFGAFVVSAMIFSMAGCPKNDGTGPGPKGPESGGEEPFVARGGGQQAGGGADMSEIKRLVGAGRCSEALEKIAALKEVRADKSYYKGVCLMKQGRSDEAMAAFDEALKHKPDFPEKYVNAAGLLIQQRKLDRAFRVLEDAVRRYSGEASLWFNLGLAAMATGRPKRGAEAFDRAASMAPARKKYQIGSGVAWLRLRRFDKALVRFEKAVKLAPASADAAEGLARSLAGLGKKTEAVQWARKAVALDPKSLGRKHLLAGLLLDAGKASEAARILQGLAERLPHKAVVFLRWGQALEKAGKKGRASVVYVSAAKKALSYPTRGAIMADIASALERMGKRRLARTLRAKAASSRPKDQSGSGR